MRQGFREAHLIPRSMPELLAMMRGVGAQELTIFGTSNEHLGGGRVVSTQGEKTEKKGIGEREEG